MKKISIIFLSFLAVSCQLFDKKVPTENELLQQELQKINWHEVDEYPSMNHCDTLQNRTQQKNCFFNQLTQEIQHKINLDSIQIANPTIDTISIKISILPDKTIVFETQKPKDSVSYNFKEIDSIIQHKLAHFPPVEPASKRGVKVKTQFILPIIYKKK